MVGVEVQPSRRKPGTPSPPSAGHREVPAELSLGFYSATHSSRNYPAAGSSVQEWRETQDVEGFAGCQRHWAPIDANDERAVGYSIHWQEMAFRSFFGQPDSHRADTGGSPRADAGIARTAHGNEARRRLVAVVGSATKAF